MNYSVEPEESYVVFTCFASFTEKDVIDALTLCRETGKATGLDKLLILDPGSAFNPSNIEIEQVIQTIRELLLETFKTAALVVQKDLHYGIGRMIESLTESAPGTLNLFKDEETAIAWLKEN